MLLYVTKMVVLLVLDTLTLLIYLNLLLIIISLKKIKSTNDLVKTVTIENGKKKENSLNLLIASDVDALLDVDNNENFEPEITLKENLNAPIKKGDIVGNITYKIDGLKYSADLLAGNDIVVAEDEKMIIFVVISGFIIILFMIRFC